MKKLLILATLLLIGCTKEQINTSKVRFDFRMVESGSMTKTLGSDAILSAINSRIPESIALTLTNKTTKAVTQVTTGQSYELELGEYEVTATYSANDKQTLHNATGAYASQRPTIKVDDEIVVTYDETQYQVDATYECFCLVVDNTETDYLYGFNNSITISTYSSGGIGLCFVSGECSNSGIAFKVMPKTAQYKQEMYVLYNDGNTHQDGYTVEYGKWYVLHPYEVTSIEGGVIFNLPDWEEGEL